MFRHEKGFLSLLACEMKESMRNMRFIIFLISVILVCVFLVWVSSVPANEPLTDSDLLVNVLGVFPLFFAVIFYIPSLITFEFEDRTFYFIRSKMLGGKHYLLIKMLSALILQFIVFAAYTVVGLAVVAYSYNVPEQLYYHFAMMFFALFAFDAIAIFAAIVSKKPARAVTTMIIVIAAMSATVTLLERKGIDIGLFNYVIPYWTVADVTINAFLAGSGFGLDVTGMELTTNFLAGAGFLVIWGIVFTLLSMFVYDKIEG